MLVSFVHIHHDNLSVIFSNEVTLSLDPYILYIASWAGEKVHKQVL